MRAITNGLEVSLCWSTSDRLHPLLGHAGGGFLCLRTPLMALKDVRLPETPLVCLQRRSGAANIATGLLMRRKPNSCCVDVS